MIAACLAGIGHNRPPRPLTEQLSIEPEPEDPRIMALIVMALTGVRRAQEPYKRHRAAANERNRRYRERMRQKRALLRAAGYSRKACDALLGTTH
jgi:hypothetical protein